MSQVISRFRVSTSAFDRPYENRADKMPPNVIYFLSVEGDVTERDYFTGLEAYLHAAYPRARFAIYVETPNHTGLSSPEQVYELLEQCAEVRRPKIVLKQFSKAFKRKYGRNLERYFDPGCKISKRELESFKSDLEALELRYEVVYALRNCGRSRGSTHPKDRFGMLIDRDRLSHVCKKQLAKINDECVKRDFVFCLSNPCFELWLYLHKVDVAATASATEQRKMLVNQKTGNDTYMASLVRARCGHRKEISQVCFQKNYLKNVEKAIARVAGLKNKMPALLDHIGTNVGELVSEMLDCCKCA